MRHYRQPTEKESKKLDEARKKTSEGIEAEKDMFSKLMPTMAKSARDDIRAGKAMRESVPAAAREGEAYNQAGFNKGGKVKKMNEGGINPSEPIGSDKKTKTPEEQAKSQKPKTGPSEFDKTLGESKADRLKAMADKVKIAPLPEGTPNLDAAVKKMEALREQMEARRAARGGGGGATLKSNRDITKNHKTGGKVSSASSRADGCAQRGKTKGRMV
jgi:hypothetical protein